MTERGHFIYLGMENRIVMLESGSLDRPPYREIDRVGRRPVYGFHEDVRAVDVIKSVASPGESVGVLCLDKDTEERLKGVGDVQGISLSVLDEDFLDRGREGKEIRDGLKRVLANHGIKKNETTWDGHMGED